MDVPVPIDARKQQILKAVVADYTETAIPVGSHALASHLTTWSSATIRNELASLVEIGYLLQPHTSAGRVPSDLGYRYYVDFLMEEEAVSPAVRQQLEPYFSDLPGGIEGVLEVAAMALSRVTDAVAMVTGPGEIATRVKHIHLVSLDPRHALVMVIVEGNLVRQHAVELSQPADQGELTAIAQHLNGLLVGQSAVEIAATDVSDEHHYLTGEMADQIVALMSALDARQSAVVLHDGFRNLLHQPEFGDVTRLQEVLELVEEERVLSEMLTSLDIAEGLAIVIGRESGVDQLSGCSLVLTRYRVGGRAGTIGILGPTRMRYSQVAPRVRFVAQRLGDALTRMLGDER